MISQKEKTRIISFSILFLANIFLLCSCNSNSKTQTHIPTADILQNEMSRQSFYAYLYNEIAQDDLLRSTYFPEVTQQTSEKLLADNFISAEYQANSYETLVYQAKKDNLSNLSISTRNYRQGKSEPREIWFWGKSNSEYAPWNTLIEDFDEIADENKAAVVFFCNAGLAKLSENTSKYTLSFKPNEKVSNEEALQLQQAVKAKTRCTPVNGISTTDHEGNEILLCFSDPTTLFMFKNTTEYLSKHGEIINSFVFFDEKGTELSLWINSVSGGMFSIPLNIGQGEPCILPCYSNVTNLKQRLNILKSLLPNEEQQKASADFETLFNGENLNKSFSYSLSDKMRADIAITFSQEEYKGTVCFKTAKY